MNEEVKWTRNDPRGFKVILKESTYTEHIIGDHSDGDTKGRIIASDFAPDIIEKPRYIFRTSSSEEQGRETYFDTMIIDETGKLRCIVVVVDAEKEPREVITVLLERKIKNTLTKEGLLYDSSSPEKHKL